VTGWDNIGYAVCNAASPKETNQDLNSLDAPNQQKTGSKGVFGAGYTQPLCLYNTAVV
jgi:hypothetical protein